MRVLLPGLVAALLAGCTVGPDYVRPTLEAPAAYKEGFEWQPAQPKDHVLRGNWWVPFGDPQLDALMERVSISNQTLLAAEAQFRQAVALAEAARAERFPTLTASASVVRLSQSGSTAGTPSGGRTVYSLPLNASWEADLWGRIRRSVESGEAAAQASAADLENARLSVRTELALDYFQLRAIDAQRRLLDNTIAAYVKSLELTRNRYTAGVVSKSDVAQAETQLKSTQAQALDLGVQRAQMEHAIAVLLGTPPALFALPATPLDAAPPEVPVGLPAELLERRPDVAAAERRVAAANAQIGVAKSAFFPSATLGATYGYQSTALGQLLSIPSRFWSVGPALAMTLFDGGRRRAISDQAIAAYDASVASYRETVLTGFKEVEDNLAALRILEQEAQVQGEAVTAAQQSLEFANNQYKAGIVNYLQVVIAQVVALNNQRSAADILARRVAASVQLVKALGGGWDAAALPAPEEMSSRAVK